MSREHRPLAHTSSLVAVVALVLCASATGAAAADEIYRWVDAEGRVIYGSEPPPDAAASEKWTPKREGSVNIVPDAARPEVLRAPPSVAVPPPSAYGDVRDEPEAIGGKSEAQWRASAARLLKKIESRQSRIETIEAELSFPSRYRSSLGAAKHETRQRRKIESLAGEIVDIENELDALRRAARKLGVPPGWLR